MGLRGLLLLRRKRWARLYLTGVFRKMTSSLSQEGMFRRSDHPRCKGATQNQHAPAVESTLSFGKSRTARHCLRPHVKNQICQGRRRALKPRRTNQRGAHLFHGATLVSQTTRNCTKHTVLITQVIGIVLKSLRVVADGRLKKRRTDRPEGATKGSNDRFLPAVYCTAIPAVSFVAKLPATRTRVRQHTVKRIIYPRCSWRVFRRNHTMFAWLWRSTKSNPVHQ